MNGSVRVAAVDTDGKNFVDDLNAGDVSAYGFRLLVSQIVGSLLTCVHRSGSFPRKLTFLFGQNQRLSFLRRLLLITF